MVDKRQLVINQMYGRTGSNMAITDDMIKRINELARKAKNEGLDPVELEEQKQLRRAYIDAFRGNLQSSLETIVVVDENGNKKKLDKKKETQVNGSSTKNKRYS